MSEEKNPSVTLKDTVLYKATISEEGDLCNAYSPLQNLTNETTQLLGDFTTEKLDFDLEHPVDIVLQDSYDGSVNMILNDGKNKPRLINSRFSVQNDTKFLIPDHTGFKDTNIYDEATFEPDTNLKPIPIQIPTLTFCGLVNNAGTLKCGSYTFYFKLADADGNETEIIQESGIVQIFIGDINQPVSNRMGLEDENASKSVKFKLGNIDSGFDYIHVLYARTSSGADQAAATNYYEIKYDYPVINGTCEIEITGNERILGTSQDKFYVDYADIQSVKTQAVLNNVLLFGNVNKPIHDWDALRRMSWKIVPTISTESNAGYVDTDYEFDKDSYSCSWSADNLKKAPGLKFRNIVDSIKDPTSDCSYGYYNPENVYYKVGYWPDEIYRFGIVYIFEDNSLSPVFNIQGVNFQKLGSNKVDPELLFNRIDYDTTSNYVEWQSENEDCYFERPGTEGFMFNSRGVVKFPKMSALNNSGSCSPKPVYISFNMKYIGACIANANDKPRISWNSYYTPSKLQDLAASEDPNKFDYTENAILDEDYKESSGDDNEGLHGYSAARMFKLHGIKGYFFVRQKRIPTILAQGLIVGLTDKDRGSIPVITKNTAYITETFLSSNASGRLLEADGRTITIDSSAVTNQAMFVPDAEMMEATFNQIFVGNKFALNKVGQLTFYFDDAKRQSKAKRFTTCQSDEYLQTSLLNVTEDTKIATDGENYFSTLAGSPHEPYKTIDVKNKWKYTPPQDLTNSDTLVRGNFGAYVGVGKVNGAVPFKYGEVYNIKQAVYATSGEDTATKLDFQKRFNSAESYSAICDRTSCKNLIIRCYRGDCFQSMFTHRVIRNFIDPELPTNDKIVDPTCWAANYGVRCTAQVLTSSHSNLTSGSDGWVIKNGAEERKKNALVQAVMLFLMGSVIGATQTLLNLADKFRPGQAGLSDSYAYYKEKGSGKGWWTGDYTPPKISLGGISFRKGNKIEDVSYVGRDGKPYTKSVKRPEGGNYYLVNKYTTSVSGYIADNDDADIPTTDTTTISVDDDNENIKLYAELVVEDDGSLVSWDADDVTKMYPNGYANEIVQAFETYIGAEATGISFFNPLKSLVQLLRYGDDYGPRKKKVNPKEQESSGGFNLKAMFKSDDDWELHGLASINRADVNAVGIGEWITFPICSTHNLALRDVDFSNATEQASFARKREFYPLRAMDLHNPLRDSNVINQATAISIPDKKYFGMPNVPFIKQEYFTRIINSLHDSADSVTNEFKVLFEDCYRDYTKVHGSITKLVPFGGNLIVVFRHGVGLIQLDLGSEYGAEGYLSVSCQIISDTFGSMWKDSVYATPTAVYGVDTVGKKIWQLSSGVFGCISDHRIGKFLIDNIDMSEFTTTPYIGHINVKTHYNAFKHDVMFTYYNDKPLDVNGDPIALIGDNSEKALFQQKRIFSWEPGTTWSICYNEDTKMFTTFYDWYPVESENIDNIYFSFDREQTNEIADEEFRTKASIQCEGLIEPTWCRELDEQLPDVQLKRVILNQRKFNIDEGFNYSVNYYKGRTDQADNFVQFNASLEANELYCISFYFKRDLKDGNDLTDLYLKVTNMDIEYPRTLKFLLVDSDKIKAEETAAGKELYDRDHWYTAFLFVIPTNGCTSEFVIQDTALENTLYFAEAKAVKLDKDQYTNERKKITDSGYYFTTIDFTDLTSNNDVDHTLYWDIRNGYKNVKLWKHGQAGIYDNQGEIKPTMWYGKQHEFNFEFVVNQPDIYSQKIFNNLWMISNKAEPYKIEYEVVGEGYEWFEWKPVILWCNQHIDADHTLLDRYKEVLSHTLGWLQSEYYDFPSVFDRESGYTIKRLPYLSLKLSDRKGTKDSNPNWGIEIMTDKGKDVDSYSDNTVETILVNDKQLSEQRVHTEQLVNNVNKYGRVRGNWQYLEDSWRGEIRPLAFKEAYIDDKDEVAFIETEESRLRDKYIKIKVRYTGEDLAIIQAMITLLSRSYA